MESSHVEEIERPWLSLRRRPDGQAEVGEHFSNHRMVFNGGNDLQAASAAMAEFSRVRTYLGLNWRLKNPEEL